MNSGVNWAGCYGLLRRHVRTLLLHKLLHQGECGKVALEWQGEKDLVLAVVPDHHPGGIRQESNGHGRSGRGPRCGASSEAQEVQVYDPRCLIARVWSEHPEISPWPHSPSGGAFRRIWFRVWIEMWSGKGTGLANLAPVLLHEDPGGPALSRPKQNPCADGSVEGAVATQKGEAAALLVHLVQVRARAPSQALVAAPGSWGCGLM